MRPCLVIIAIALLVRATALDAEIIHCPTNFILGDVWFPQTAEYFDLDLDLNGTVDFSLMADIVWSAGIHPENQNQYLIHPSPPPNIGGPVAALNSTYVIGLNSTVESSLDWFGSDNYSTLIFILDSGITGEFYHDRAFVGLKFEADDGIHYGWIDVEGASRTMENHLLTDSSLIIHGWAYESTPGVGIAAGAVPEPSSVALFAIGAVGVWILRKEKKEKEEKGSGKGTSPMN